MKVNLARDCGYILFRKEESVEFIRRNDRNPTGCKSDATETRQQLTN